MFFRNFKKALTDLILSRHAIHIMNTLYPTATADDLERSDNVCIICREEMSVNCKKLPCNHIFHTNCLTTWFQRQQTCPTCRLDVLTSLDTNNGRNQVPNVFDELSKCFLVLIYDTTYLNFIIRRRCSRSYSYTS